MAVIAKSIIAELCGVVGSDHVLTSEAAVDANSRDISPWKTRGAAVVLPASTEEVAAVVRIAHREKLPLWTFSGGWNWGYGAAMGLEDGAIILLLRRMNRILEVNTELAYAVIEPGVTQGQLREHLDANNTGLWTDCTDSTPKGSIIGNALEHGVGYTPLCDHFGALCGVEAVLADGTIVRTGGGPPNSTTWHTHRWGTGPSIDGLFGQSNLGIVTRAGVWLMPAPEEARLFLLELSNEAKLAAVVDVFRELAIKRLIPANLHVVNDVLFAAILGDYPRDLLRAGQTFLDDSARRELRQRYNIAPVSVTGGLYGSRAQVREQQALIKQRLGRFGRIHIVNRHIASLLPGLSSFWERYGHVPGLSRALRRATGASPAKLRATQRVYDLLRGIPSEFVLGFAYFKARGSRPEQQLDPARDGAGMIWSPCALPLTGHHVATVTELSQRLYREHGFDYSNAFISLNPRTTMSLMQIFFDRDDPDEAARALGLQRALFEACQRAGYPQYRTGMSFHKQMFADNPGYLRTLGAIKDALDPNGILAPGRYGLG